ncbi:MAG: WD40 repeat domain-containing protein [Anaerolineae bacterium]|nr:WD40 repeat domain-containing protein [Anaerolineae bacterium]
MNKSFFFIGIAFIVAAIFPILAQEEDARTPRDIPTNVITSIDWSPDGQLLAVANNSGSIQIRSVSTGDVLRTLATTQPTPILTAAWSPDGSWVAGTVNTEVYIWNTETWQPVHILQGHLDPVWSVAWSPDGTKLASIVNVDSPNFNFYIWNTATGRQIQSMEYPGYFYQVAWSPDNVSIATTGGARIQLWNVSQTTQVNYLGFTNLGEVVDADWSPDGTQIASVGDNGYVVIWDITSKKMVRELEGHLLSISDLVFSVDWSPDGSRIASASTDGTVRVWEVETGEQLGVIEVGSEVYSVAWSPDGTKLAYGGENDLFEIVPAP